MFRRLNSFLGKPNSSSFSLRSLRVSNLFTKRVKNPKDQEGPVFAEQDSELYEKFKPEVTGNPVLIEGPNLGQDFSYFLVNGNDEMKDLEKGIPLSNFCEEA